MAKWRIVRTSSSMIFDKFGSPISGYTLDVELLPWNEFLQVDVPSLEPDDVKATLDQLFDNRKQLDELSALTDEE